jgi:hypothetical protein
MRLDEACPEMKALAFALMFVVGLSGSGFAQCDSSTGFCKPPGLSASIDPEWSKTRFVFHKDRTTAPAPWATAVRIKGYRGQEISVGSGTIIESTLASSLVMTCAHVIRGNSVFSIEIFGPSIDQITGSVGSSLGKYQGRAIVRNDKHDVGLMRFSPGKILPASPLPLDETLSYGTIVGSVGCSSGDDPTALSCRFISQGEMKIGNARYQGMKVYPSPVEGRSGGGLFDLCGHLIGVCDFGSPDDNTGLYASTDSLRQILRENGLTELSLGMSSKRREPPAPTPVSPPAKAPDPAPIERVGDDLGELERDGWDSIKPLIHGSIGGGFVGLIAWVVIVVQGLKRRKPSVQLNRTLTRTEVMTLEEIGRQLDIALRKKDEEDAQAKADSERIERIREALKTPRPESPKS